MQDGRAFTDYTPDCIMNQKIQEEYNVNDMSAYRKFLQNNAEKLMSDFQNKNTQKACPVCKKRTYKPMTNDKPFA